MTSSMEWGDFEACLQLDLCIVLLSEVMNRLDDNVAIPQWMNMIDPICLQGTQQAVCKKW